MTTSVGSPDPVVADPEHPDSSMYSPGCSPRCSPGYSPGSSRRRLVHGDQQRDVEVAAGSSGWVPAQRHRGENIGDTPTHALFVELEESPPPAPPGRLGPE